MKWLINLQMKVVNLMKRRILGDLQVGTPLEEDLASWGHHFSPNTVPDTIFQASVGDEVKFVFKNKISGKLVPVESVDKSKGDYGFTILVHLVVYLRKCRQLNQEYWIPKETISSLSLPMPLTELPLPHQDPQKASCSWQMSAPY